MRPTPLTGSTGVQRDHQEAVYRATLKCGVSVRAQRDGVVSFYFALWDRAPSIEFAELESTGNIAHVTPAWLEAQEHGAVISVYRAAVMNAHQACLVASQAIVGIEQRTGYEFGPIGSPVSAWNTYKAWDIDKPIPYATVSEDPRQLARIVANHNWSSWSAGSRRAISLQVLERSFQILDSILTADVPAFVEIVEAIYIASSRHMERRFGESIVLSWTACEQLIALDWQTLIDDVEKRADGARMPRKRKRKLTTGREYTAAVRTEILELMGTLGVDLYNKLEVARKARNAWAHALKHPTEAETRAAIEAAQQLTGRLLGLDFQVYTGVRAPVPLARYIESSGRPESL
jgi:hypothetical protein